MLRSTSSSGTKRFDAGHRAERIFVLSLFACLASAPRNERDIGDLSTIPKHLDSWGKTAGMEVPQHHVNPGTLDHLHHGQPSLLGKDGILDFMILGKGKLFRIGNHAARIPQPSVLGRLKLAMTEHPILIFWRIRSPLATSIVELEINTGKKPNAVPMMPNKGGITR